MDGPIPCRLFNVQYRGEELEETPILKRYRNSLASSSRVHNLFFFASADTIHVYQPVAQEQWLSEKPVLILHPPVSRPSLGHYLDPAHPHSINFLHVDRIGTEEIIGVVCDDGDVIVYRTAAIQRAVKHAIEFPKAKSEPIRTLLHKNVGMSAWGFAVHREARMIAVSANTAQVKVFAFGLTQRPPISSLIPLEHSKLPTMPHDTGEHTLPDRSKDSVIILTAHGNIPSVSFDNTGADPNGRWLFSSSINGMTHLWDLYNPQMPARAFHVGNCFQTRSPTKDPGPLATCGCGSVAHATWGSIFIDPAFCISTKTTKEAFGGVPVQKEPCFLDITHTRIQRDTTTESSGYPWERQLTDADRYSDTSGLSLSTPSDSEGSEHVGTANLAAIMASPYSDSDGTNKDEMMVDPDSGSLEDTDPEDTGPENAGSESVGFEGAPAPMEEVEQVQQVQVQHVQPAQPQQQIPMDDQGLDSTWNPWLIAPEVVPLPPAAETPDVPPPPVDDPPANTVSSNEQMMTWDESNLELGFDGDQIMQELIANDLLNFEGNSQDGDSEGSDGQNDNDEDDEDDSLASDEDENSGSFDLPNGPPQVLANNAASATGGPPAQPTVYTVPVLHMGTAANPITLYRKPYFEVRAIELLDRPRAVPDRPCIIITKEEIYLLQTLASDSRADVNELQPIISMWNPLFPDRQEMGLRPGWTLRLNFFEYLPELAAFIVGSNAGRCAIFSLTESPHEKDGKKTIFGFRQEHILPSKKWEESSSSSNMMVGMTVAPFQGMEDPEEGYETGTRVVNRRWKLTLLFLDHTVLTYEFTRNLEDDSIEVSDLLV